MGTDDRLEFDQRCRLIVEARPRSPTCSGGLLPTRYVVLSARTASVSVPDVVIRKVTPTPSPLGLFSPPFREFLRP